MNEKNITTEKKTYTVSHLSGEDCVQGALSETRLTKLLTHWGFIGHSGREIWKQALPRKDHVFLFEYHQRLKTFKLFQKTSGVTTEIEKGTCFDTQLAGSQITFFCQGTRVTWQIVCNKAEEKNDKFSAVMAPKTAGVPLRNPPPSAQPKVTIEDPVVSQRKSEVPIVATKLSASSPPPATISSHAAAPLDSKRHPAFKILGMIEAKVSEIQPFKEQPRKDFGAASEEELGESLYECGGAVTPIHVKEVAGVPGIKYELINGERRWRAAKAKGILTLNAVLCEVKDVVEQHLLAMLCNKMAKEHTHLETYRGLAFQREAGKSVAELRRFFGYSAATIYQHLALERLHPELLPLIDPPTPKVLRVSLPAAMQLAQIPKEYQLGIWAKASKVQNRNGIVTAIKRLAEESVPGFQKQVDPHASARQFRTWVARLHAEVSKYNPAMSVIGGHIANNWPEDDNQALAASLDNSAKILLLFVQVLRREQRRVSEFKIAV
jgi:ParB/RepB/Spo0J family partition protein